MYVEVGESLTLFWGVKGRGRGLGRTLPKWREGGREGGREGREEGCCYDMGAALED